MSNELGAFAQSESSIFALVRRQFTKPKPLPTDIRLTGKNAIITGSNAGLGAEAARQLLGLGLSHLIMGVRSQTKGEAAAQEPRKEFTGATIDVWVIDMNSYDSIRAFASRCETLSRIDIVLLNAGVLNGEFSTNASTGHESSLQVNYLSTALLTILLLPILKTRKSTAPGARPPVLSLVGSDTMYMANWETQGPVLRQFDEPSSFDPLQTYAKSKLVLMLFVTKLADFVNSNDVVLQVVNPGMTASTGLSNNRSWMDQLMTRILHFLMARSTETGATTYVDAVVGKGVESHGSFVSEWTIKPYPVIWYEPEGKEITKRLWEETMEELNFVRASNILGNLKGQV
ncbi:hypothetical protein PFICI_15316 [Pestalotiopsis fici W106-1]|uniref:Uncharacterized protein n=1 Tax=Pestalotiopsis fici (strain W106-1 / CGMCC3.15140) TaxID=1229662 RepID=W3WGJ2_PESFW|nr:uncharacterized protein PFICI_15316 [Pestalotiopsis fici W106-1]ETS72924.1 hypothetical protein PFICI_15316 [Pestalotiopsis fici W106-1]